MTAYIGLIRKEQGSDYGVDFPDFPGCVTAGRTADEAQRMAIEALALHLDGMLEDRQPLPRPTPLQEIMALPENREAQPFTLEAPAPHAWKPDPLDSAPPKRISG